MNVTIAFYLNKCDVKCKYYPNKIVRNTIFIDAHVQPYAFQKS